MKENQSPVSPHPQNLLFKVVNNSAALMGGELFYRFVNFFSCIMIARALGSEYYGQFSFIYAYLSFFEALVQFGMNPILVRRLSQEKENTGRVLGNAIVFRTALVAAAFPIVVLTAKFFGYPISVRQGLFLAYFQLFLTLRPIFETVFRIRLLMVYPAIWNGVRALLNLALVALAASFHPALPWFIATYFVSGIIALTGLAISSQRLLPVDLRWDKKIMGELVRDSAPLVVSAYLTLLCYRVDIFMLSFMKGFSEVGFYSVATRFTEAVMMISTALLSSFFPLIARAFKENREEFDKVTHRAFMWFFLISLPMALGGFLVSRDVVKLFFGPTYATSGIVLSILCFHIAFSFIASLGANILIACGKQKTDMKISFSLVFVNIGLNLLLIPFWGSKGSATAVVLTEMTGMFIYMAVIVRNPEIRLRFPWKELFLSLKINASLVAILFVLKYLGVPALFLIACGGIACVALWIGFKVLAFEDLKGYFSHTFRKNKNVFANESQA